MASSSSTAARSGAGAIYKGLAIAANPDRLYAADFHGAKIDVFDQGFAPTTVPGGFVDPNLPAGFAPFNVQEIAGEIVAVAGAAAI